jgi:hypothetical protein
MSRPLAMRCGALLMWTAWVAGAPAFAHGDTVYRCANGSYSQQPCAQGQAIDVEDARTSAQQREAAEAAQREAALAQALAREREAREAAPGPRAIAIGSAPKPPHAASAPTHKKKSSTRHRHHHAAPSVATADEEDDGLSAPVRVPSPAAR